MINRIGVLMFTGRMTIKDGRGAGFRGGSVLILVVLLMVLLSVLGMMFLLMSRLDEMATWSISETRELEAGVEVIVNQINRVLVEDLFDDDGMMFNPDASDEYYDYPGPEDAWLGSLEPLEYGSGDYRWRWISDIYGYGFNAGLGGTLAQIVAEHEPVVPGAQADADGDGVADSRWVPVPNISTSKGRTIYAAVRIVDNGGMVNVNTAYRDPTALTTMPGGWDGSMLSHVNLEGIISTRDWEINNLNATAIQRYRYGTVTSGPGPQDFDHYYNDVQYEVDVARRILNPDTISTDESYMPFDISDELELRNRFFLKSLVVTPIETVWPATFDPGDGPVGKQRPYYEGDESDNDKLQAWFLKATSPGENGICNRRHLSTAYNFDRVMVRKVDISGIPLCLRDGQDGQDGWYDWTRWNLLPESWRYKPVCVNDYGKSGGPTIEQIAGALWLGLDETTAGFDDLPANPPGSTEYDSWSISPEDLVYQLTVNLIDYIDTDPNSTVYDFGGATTYYGFEETQRDVYISEIAVARYNDGTSTETYYAMGLYNPWTSDVDLSGWQLVINGAVIYFDSMSDSRIVPAGNVLVIVDSTAPTSSANIFSPASVLNGLTFTDGDHITLLSPSGRPVDGIFVGVDVSGSTSSNPAAGSTDYYNIDRGNRLIGNRYPVWDTSATWTSTGSATNIDDFTVGAGTDRIWKERMQLMTRDNEVLRLRTIGEIFNVLGIGASVRSDEYRTLPEWLGAYYNTAGDDLEAITAGRMDATDPNYAKVLNYVTVFNPFNDGDDNDGDVNTGEDVELQVAGRININTAPWFVIAQLPWMQYTTAGDNYLRARAIVASRVVDGPYRNITELMRVGEMLNLGSDGDDNNGPDFTLDTAKDDLEERDVIFSRVSNLVTVRSDVFTAYILVRLGRDGPQRRMIGIFDRSGVFSRTDKPKVVALHPVPDPR
jgi:hypothetical protein